MTIRSVEDPTESNYIDFLEDQLASVYTFKLFGKEPEDYSRWSLIADYSQRQYATFKKQLTLRETLLRGLTAN